MNLYIINEVLVDFTAGMVVIAAESMEDCRELFLSEFPSHSMEFDDIAEFKVIENVNHPAGLISYVYGGG